MERSRFRPLLGGFLFMALFGLVGAPSAPISGFVPTVGGAAMADPCDEGWGWEDCEPPTPVEEPPDPPQEDCRGDGYDCAPDRVPADCTSMPAVLGYAAGLTTMASLAVPILAVPAVILGVAAYYVSATCAALDDR